MIFLRAQRFQMLIASLSEGIWVSNLIGGLSKGRGSLLFNFRFLRHETTKLGPLGITVKGSEVSWPPLLAVLSIVWSGCHGDNDRHKSYVFRFYLVFLIS